MDVPAPRPLLERRLAGTAAPALTGALGSALIGWGSCSPEFAFGPDGWPSGTVNAIGLALPIPWDRVAIVAGVLLLVAAWWLARPRADAPAERRRVLILLATWSLPLLLVPPVLSADAVLYADLGWIVNQGLNPYQVGLGGAGGPYAPHVDPLWMGNGVAYPPLALLTDAAVVRLVGFAVYPGIIAMRLPVLISLAVIAWVLPRLARRFDLDASRTLWWGLANPLVIVHFVGGAHNDAMMVAVALVGLWVALARPGWAWSLLAGPAVIGVAMAFKQQAGLAVIACAGVPVAAGLARRPIVRRLTLLAIRTIPATLVAAGVFVVISLASGLGFGWTAWLSLMGKAGTAAPFSVVAQVGEGLIERFGGDPSGWLAAVGTISTLTLLVTLAWMTIRFADRPLALVAWGSLAVSGLGQSMHPWYIPWSLALLSLVALSRRQCGWVTAFAVVFVIWNAIQTVVWHGVT